MSAYSIVFCWLVGFVFFIYFSNYNNLKQGNFKKRIQQNNPSLCVKLLTEDMFKPSTIWWSRQPTVTVKSLSNDNGDVNRNGKNAVGLISKTTTSHVHHAFLHISLPSLHDYNVKNAEFPPWPLAGSGFVHGSPWFKYSTTLVNSQLVCLRPVGILHPIMFDLNCSSYEFARPHWH